MCSGWVGCATGATPPRILRRACSSARMDTLTYAFMLNFVGVVLTALAWWLGR
ncbi:hypothetical protein SAMN04487948_12033 [Halogranum amylolyticum]|uniref:Uncharacterized protein n=1 Tax=Halogranum amylolyticum TaxID=660520 RepID=A0A1H8VWD4_9EURY|nr:hypothetical protein SAMN04487948_12033 [Halogranum amylolyticum]